jgi:hypothetical protein
MLESYTPRERSIIEEMQRKHDKFVEDLITELIDKTDLMPEEIYSIIDELSSKQEETC